ncbi:alpha/beta hydrolase [Actinospica sp. MGRD01-02]|uniref:Alpha/beta hydrolase n=1 Tax=Actinospica acidithermotolerans TaxID=2828514 RepID=A0A941EF01_9ACTN|nr:alpha/beta hydrolase [Actinospica acidithermotolerans]MBR7827844.1 alpha/beta hydrolase [Actinospica acidithermotolerans]
MPVDDYRVGTVRSADGTDIGYRRRGEGPAVVLLHGSMESGLNHVALGDALANEYTVVLPDRRGRGLSGAHRPGHDIGTEVADLSAVITHCGAERVFGVSAGGLVALETARRHPEIKRLALYEPALLSAAVPFDFDWIGRFDDEIAAGNVPAAMVTSMIGLKLGPGVLRLFPRSLLAGLTNMMLKAEDKKAGPSQVTLRKLAPTIRYEGVIIEQRRGAEQEYAAVAADVLMMSGGKGLPWLRPGMDALAQRLPRVRRVEYPDLDHGGSSDVTKANPKGRPDLIAKDILEFFRG